MKSTLLTELHYLGNIEYFTNILKYDTIQFEQHENYRKGSYRNRCYVVLANTVLALSIPLLKGKHQQAPIRSVKIDNRQNWQTMHWRSIQTAYGNAPFFEFYADYIRPFYEKEWEFLFDFNWTLQQQVCTLLGIPTALEFSATYTPKDQLTSTTIDFRNQILPKNRTKPAIATNVLVEYPQVFEDRHGFIPNLSILDLLFCTGSEALVYLQQSIRL